MKDTIYRQDAIDALLRLGDSYLGQDEVKRGIAQSQRIIYELPSAEPRKILFGSCLEYSGISNLPSAEPEIIRCKDCKHWERDAIFDEGWCRWKQQGEPNWFCGDGERRENERPYKQAGCD